MKAVSQLIKDMKERPHDFYCDDFHMTDSKTKIVYWIANGFGFYRICKPYILKFGFIDQVRFNSALNRWKNAYAVRLAALAQEGE